MGWMDGRSDLVYVHICGFYFNIQKIIRDLSHEFGSCSVSSSSPDEGSWVSRNLHGGSIYVGKPVLLQLLRFILKIGSMGIFQADVMTQAECPWPWMLPWKSGGVGYKLVSCNLNPAFWHSVFHGSWHCKFFTSFRQNAHSPRPYCSTLINSSISVTGLTPTSL